MKNVSFLCLLKAKKENLFLIWFCLHFGNEFFKYIVGISVWLMYMYIYVWIKLRWTVIQKNWESWSEIDLASLLLLLTNWSSVVKDAKWRMRGNHCKPNPEVWSCGSFCLKKKNQPLVSVCKVCHVLQSQSSSSPLQLCFTYWASYQHQV